MSGKQVFLQFIQNISTPYLHEGFVATQKGLILKQRIESSDFELVLKFHAIQSEVKTSVQLSCLVMVLSEQLKAWRLQKYRSKDLAVDTVFIANLNDVIPVLPKKFSWEINSKNLDDQTAVFSELLSTYVNPIFEQFRNREALIAYTIEQGWRFNVNMSPKQFVYPLDFMACFASYEENCLGFNNFIKQEGLVGQARRIYKEMSSPKYKGYIRSDAIEDKLFQQAYLHKIPIW
ncbi:hypothetical protein HX045_14730 [Myroides odoratimimus]|uniref:hypothetical protein n=1 Tax=Myroides TaxID=76831 RepID=UPI00024601E4|nr:MULTISPECIES: hypothetical protein [Myroides]EHO07430.1 hypothetical protein HMPREF9714_02510 [Myroides odoratimimus CCUG 12901]MDM1035137.1 hypothetical protein [Myroides odoratimimus]MDM1038851.1 hypothetical protein [Myroides odoratimimus]MDM1052969.1 hypothetical protein [Myroides odoratimimus]MDM1093988.1 hypothetical protein [Myroides odoratimimus]